jgi:hypothetical protein
LQEKAHEIDDIRHKITRVAELYERKPITQKYSFEVLCDFISDKAKRLFSKYDQLHRELESRQKTQVQADKLNSYTKKLDHAEQELRHCRQMASHYDRIVD